MRGAETALIERGYRCYENIVAALYERFEAKP